MSMRSFESAILNELRRQPGCSQLRAKDIMEWSTGDVAAQEGETVVHLPLNNVNVAYKPGASNPTGASKRAKR